MTGARQHLQPVLTVDQAARICAERGANSTLLHRRVFEALRKLWNPGRVIPEIGEQDAMRYR